MLEIVLKWPYLDALTVLGRAYQDLLEVIASEPDNLSADIPTTPFLFHLEHVFRAVLFWGQVKLKLDTSNVMSTVPVDRGIPVE